MKTAYATVIMKPDPKRPWWYQVTDGPHTGAEFVASDSGDLKVGQTVFVTFLPDDQFARRVNGFPLKTRAITTYRDEGPKECGAHVRFKDGRPSLIIEGTPGQWALATLLGVDDYHGYDLRAPAEAIAIDHGQRWILMNQRALVAEALARVLGEDPPAPGACRTCKGAGGKCIICKGSGKLVQSHR